MAKKNISVTKSFSYKLGQPNYSSVDFFCAVTETCEKERAGEVAAKLDEFCKASVRLSMTEFVESVAAKEKAEVEKARMEREAKLNAAAKKLDAKDSAKQSAELGAGTSAAQDLSYESTPEMTQAFGK